MLYQKMLLSSKPCVVLVGAVKAFEVHRHPEMELSFCMEGEYDLICEHKRYTLSEGDFALVPPMLAHEIPRREGAGRMVTVVVGSALLGEVFDYFTNQSSLFLCRKGQGGAPYGELEALLRETAMLHRSEEAFRELSIKGNVYKICALLLQMLNLTEAEGPQNKKRTDLKKIDQALEQIYNYYDQPLTVEEVSAFCGYGKSNFCKIFKSITGNTFHYVLNRHRVEVACMLLKESDQTVEEIARDTGFADAKSFCRVFKKFMGQSAGAYRKSTKNGPAGGKQ